MMGLREKLIQLLEADEQEAASDAVPPAVSVPEAGSHAASEEQQDAKASPAATPAAPPPPAREPAPQAPLANAAPPATMTAPQQWTAERIEAMSLREINANWDDISAAMQQEYAATTGNRS